MPVYLVARITIADREAYARYESGFPDIFSRHNGNILSVDEGPVVLEGEWPCTRTVLLEFPSEEDAMSWYRSPEYQALARHRFDASSADIVMIRGLGGRPEPAASSPGMRSLPDMT